MKTIRKITQCILIGLTALMVQTAYAQKQVSDRALNCDSTCITPDSRTNTLPKANTSTAPTATAPRTPNPSCGPAAGTALPGAPSSLCSIGTASAVSSSTADGETSYKWTCSNSVGSIACMADQREAGICGSDNGKTLTSTPTDLCSAGASVGYALLGTQYTWMCKGNYGSPASCSATRGPVCKMVEAGESCGTAIIGWQAVDYNSIWQCGYEPYTYSCAPIYGGYSCSMNYVQVCTYPTDPPPAPTDMSKTITRTCEGTMSCNGSTFTSTYVPLNASEGYISSRESQGPWGKCRYDWQTASQDRIIPKRLYDLNGLSYWVISLDQWKSYTNWYGICYDTGS